MNLSSRQKVIMQILLEKDEYVSMDRIAKKIKVSKKTISREITQLRHELKDKNIEIVTKIGSGVCLHITDELRNSLSLKILSEDCLMMDDRRYKILVDLLQNAPQMTSINKLSEQYYISKSSIQNDLKYIEEWLKEFHLILIKNIQGTGIKGKEIHIRKALTIAFLRYQGNDDCLVEISNRIGMETQATLYQQFKKDMVDYVEQLISIAEKELGYIIGEPYYINIMSHILILIHRVNKGNKISHSDIGISKVNVHVFRVAVEIASKIEMEMNIEIPDSEIYYIYQHLDSIGYSNEFSLSNQKLTAIQFDDCLKAYCDEMLNEMSHEMMCDFRGDAYLKRYLLLHLHSMIGRQKYQIDISCPLLSVVQKDYAELFDKIDIVIARITLKFYPHYSISKDEVAYLTLYFQGSLEDRLSKKMRIIVVCSSGIGTSHLLMTRIQKTFPNWEIVDQLASSLLDCEQLEERQIDLIVSTVHIANYNHRIPLAYVSVMFNERDIQNVRQVLSKKGKS